MDGRQAGKAIALAISTGVIAKRMVNFASRGGEAHRIEGQADLFERYCCENRYNLDRGALPIWAALRIESRV